MHRVLVRGGAGVMTRRDEHFDAMMRHLGAAYYKPSTATGPPLMSSGRWNRPRLPTATTGKAATARTRHHSGRWRVSGVMTTDVVTAGTATSYQQVARIMTKQKV